MSKDLSGVAKEKLSKLVFDLERTIKKISELIEITSDNDDLFALGALNDRAALYLQDILLIMLDERPMNIDAVIELIDLAEHFIDQVDSI